MIGKEKQRRERGGFGHDSVNDENSNGIDAD